MGVCVGEARRVHDNGHVDSPTGWWIGDCGGGRSGGNKADRDYSNAREGGGSSGRDSSGRGNGDKGSGRVERNPDGYGYGTGSNQEDFYPSTWGQAVYYATSQDWLGLMPNYIPTGFPPRFTQAIINIRAEYLRVKVEAAASAAAAVVAAKAEAEYKVKVVAESELLKDEPLLSPDIRTSIADALLDVKVGQEKTKDLQYKLDHIIAPSFLKKRLQSDINKKLSPEINKLNVAIEKLKPVYEQAKKEKETVLKAQEEKEAADLKAKEDAEALKVQQEKEVAEKAAQDVKDAEDKAKADQEAKTKPEDALKEAETKPEEDVKSTERVTKADKEYLEKIRNEIEVDQARKDHEDEVLRKYGENVAMEQTIKDAIAEFKDKKDSIEKTYSKDTIVDILTDQGTEKISKYLLKSPWPPAKVIGAGIWASHKIYQCNINNHVEFQRDDAIIQLQKDEKTFYDSLTKEQIELYPHLVQELYHE
jgi:hypothetical protein